MECLGIEFRNELLQHPNQVVKRSLDIVLATIGLIIALPIIALCALLIKLVSPGPIFFRQEREGLHGQTFRVWKLRTMYADAETRLAELLLQNPDLRAPIPAKCQTAPGPASDTSSRKLASAL